MAADVRRLRPWAAVAAVSCLMACCSGGSVGAQLISTDLTNSTLALTSKGFADALTDSHISTITLDCELLGSLSVRTPKEACRMLACTMPTRIF